MTDEPPRQREHPAWWMSEDGHWYAWDSETAQRERAEMFKRLELEERHE